MSSQPPPKSGWASDRTRRALRHKLETFWNLDYFEKIIIPLLNIPDGAQVLDVGCGVGALAILLAQRLPGATITGLDREPPLIHDANLLAAEMGLSNTRFQVGDANQLPFESGTFDLVACQTVLTHVHDPARVISEMARVLKSGGTFLAAEGYFKDPSTVFTSSHPPSDPAQQIEEFRLVRLLFAGKKAQGRGDNTIGLTIPHLIQQAGLQIVDVRHSDRVFSAYPPYDKPGQSFELERLHHASDPSPMSDAARERITATLVAGGATGADVQRYFEVYGASDNSAALREALDQQTVLHLSVVSALITIGRKPGQSL